MDMTVAKLRHLNVAALQAAADCWRRQGRRLSRGEHIVLADATGPLTRAGWSGAAGGAARHHLDWLDDRIQIAATTAALIARTLAAAAEKWRQMQDRLAQLFEDAARHGLAVDDDGVRLPAVDAAMRQFDDYRLARQQLVAAAVLLRRQVTDLLVTASGLDQQVALVLDRLQPFSPGRLGDSAHEVRDTALDAAAVAHLAGHPASSLPTPGTAPRLVAAWWHNMSVDDRELLLQAYGQQLGSLDGLPSADRNTANRSYLDFCHGGGGPNAGAVRQLRELLETADHQQPGQLLLLGFDERSDGQAVVAVGDPDRAAHTAVLVPGIRTDLADMPRLIDHASDIRFAADQMTAAPADVSVVAWLGYNPPEGDSRSLQGERAHEGAQALDAFVDGLHVSHGLSPSHLTAIGHSYGSVVIGETDGLAAGDVIVAGSPGMRVGHAADLHPDPRHVWAAHADGDPISGLLGSLPFVHGREPADEAFGANRFRTDTTGHSDYWRPGSLSLANQAAIIVGDYSSVQLQHGALP